MYTYICIYDPGVRFRGPPPPPNGLGPPRRRDRSSRLVCVEASQHALHVYIHTDYTYTHTYLQTNTYIHQYMHVHTDTPHPPTGGRGILYIHTYILTYKYIHTSIHACTYRHAPPTHRGGAGGRPLVPPTYKNLCTQTLWGGVGGGACRPGPYIYLVKTVYSSFSCRFGVFPL